MKLQNGKKNLVIVNSFSGLISNAKNLKLTLFVYGLKDTTKPDDIAKNYYFEEDYHAAPELKTKLNAPFIRQEVETMLKEAQSIYSKYGTEILVKSDE